MTQRILILFIGLVSLVAGQGCMRVGPDYQQPDIGVKFPQAFQHTPSGEMQMGSASDRWWQVFNDPDLNRIVAEVLERNLDIQKAAARILEVQSRFIQTRADRWPSLTLRGQMVTRQQTTNIAELGLSGFSFQPKKTTTDIYSLSLPASFELDLWGRLSRAEEAARADLLAAEESGLVIAQSVVAEAISTYLQLESLERRIQINRGSIENYRRSLAFVEKRYERGLTPILDLYQARRVLAQAESSLPSLRQELGISQQRLAVLLGRYPRTRPARLQQEDYYQRLTPVPPGLPSELLMRRPDVRAAEAQLRALNARVGLAKANRFPRITLTGSFGYSTTELAELFEPQNELITFVEGISHSLFSAGKLKAGQRIAEARYAQGVAEYARTVLTAFFEVERALLTRKEQLERRERVLRLLKEARATQKVAQSRYEKGLVSFLTVLDSQQSRFRAEESIVLADLAVLTNRVSLHRALGGGWGAEVVPTVEQ